MSAWELLIALPAARHLAAAWLAVGFVSGAALVLAFFWRWPAHGPEARRLRLRLQDELDNHEAERLQLADARAQVRDLLDQNKRLARLYAEAQRGRG